MRHKDDLVFTADLSGKNIIVINPEFVQDLKCFIDDLELPSYNFNISHGYGDYIRAKPYSEATKKLIHAYWSKMYPIILENNWLEKAFCATLDESSDRELTKFYYDSIKEVASEIPILVSGMTESRYKKAKGAGNIWNVYQYSGDLYNQGIKDGERFIQNYVPRPDKTGFDNRKWTLFLWKSGFTGLLEWSTTYWTTNPWEDVNPTSSKGMQKGQLRRYGPGNGVVFYPPDKNYKVKGKSVKKNNFTIVPSIRLELLREGIEDYEYFYMLKQVKEETDSTLLRYQAEALLQKLDNCIELKDYPGTHIYKCDKDNYMQIRNEIAIFLEKVNSLRNHE